MYFFEKNDGLQNQSVLYVMSSLKARPEVLLDPNKLSKDGTVSLSGYAPSYDGRYLAYGVADAGSDWQEWRIRDIETGRDLSDRVRWVKFSGASWTRDGKGFFYSRYDEPDAGSTLTDTNYFQKLYYHKVGTAQSEDTLIHEDKQNKDFGFYGRVTDDGRYLVITVTQGTDRRNRVLYKDLAKENAPVVELIDKFEAEFDFVGNDGTVFWFRSDLWAPRGQVVAIDVTKPQRAHWKKLIPQVTATLRRVTHVGGHLFARYLMDAKSKVAIFNKEGRLLRTVNLPGMGSVRGFEGEASDPETFFSFESFTQPRTIYRYDVASAEQNYFQKPEVAVKPDDYVTEQVFYTSGDGTRIPMFLSYKKGIQRNGANPTLLYGYGGFDIAVTPRFRVPYLVWMDMGGIFAVANIRGGGEYGSDWHDAGRLLNKQNCFDDFIAAAEWLIKSKYTSTPKLAIAGASNGGLLVGACMTQRPDLFAAALADVGVMDMLRFHKFTIGWAWKSDYGDVEGKPADFKAAYAYSPYHNLKAGTAYPATLITTADHDDRVVPAHSFKFAARLQEVQSGPAPTLIRIETRAGHGAGKPTTKQIEEAADRWAFLVKNLNMNVEGKF